MSLIDLHYKLKNHNLKIDFPYDDKFTIFKINNFLDIDSYEFIKNNFPQINFNEFKHSLNKYSLKNKEDHYKNLIKNNHNFFKIHNFFFSKEFNNFFFKKLFLRILKSRFKDINYFLRLLKIKNFNNFKNKYFFSNLETKIEYSFLRNNAEINPHTDSIKKLISLMLYFPDNKFDENKQKNFGTEFWSTSMSNYYNKHLNSDFDKKQFKKENKLVYKTSFEKYHLYGFIRNDLSWHSVNNILMDNEYLRRSININIYFS
jgi:hypothetical protein